MTAERPDLLVGAGTVLTPEQARKAKECGAAFAVAPGFNPDVVKAAQDVDLPFFPGVMTPSDIEGALSLGCRMLKFFPAGPAGGPDLLKGLAAPYRHLGVRFMPTGGVTLANLCDYLSIPEVVAAGGTWIAKSDVIASGDWGQIEANAREAVARVRERV
jgi:2-dehydro-3-deoxyphosphogluconate aldolase/(4S)-4-hydroxy-2-oxoglutarate aldolase